MDSKREKGEVWAKGCVSFWIYAKGCVKKWVSEKKKELERERERMKVSKRGLVLKGKL